MTTVLFLVTYSRTEVVRHELDASAYPSPVDRAPEDEARLRVLPEGIVIFEVQGFLFFGTANRLLDRLAVTLASEAPPRYLVIDLRRLTGLDSSAIRAFARAAQRGEHHGTHLVLSGVRGRVAQQVASGALAGSVVHAADRVGSAELVEQLRRNLREERHGAGAVLIGQGEEAGDLLFVHSGVVTAVLAEEDGGTRRLRTMAAGNLVGEIGFTLGSSRAASVVAETEVTIRRLRAADLRRIERDDPELAFELHRLVAHHLAVRLSDTLRTIRALGR